MATKKKASAKPAGFVSTTEFSSFKEEMTSSMSTLIDLVKEVKSQPVQTPEAIAVEKEIKKADPNAVVVNPEWEEAALSIIGEAVDHCEVQHLKNGGLLFTVVIKEEFSNAPKDYLARHKQDRRSKEIGTEGFGGVETWCKLIKSNLARPRANY